MKKKRYARGRLRTQLIAFYVTEEEKDFVAKMATDADQSISDYCRKTLIGSNSLPAKEREVDKLQISMFSEG